MKDILQAMKNGDWQKNQDDEIKIAGITLKKDEFELKLLPKNNDEEKFAIAPLPNNKYLISLDINITQDLEYEGVARDIIRLVQQNRKEADLNISDKIELNIQTNDHRISDVVEQFSDYIAKQVLANKVSSTTQDLTDEFIFENEIDEKAVSIGIKIIE